jgi:hypothetical protein
MRIGKPDLTQAMGMTAAFLSFAFLLSIILK